MCLFNVSPRCVSSMCSFDGSAFSTFLFDVLFWTMQLGQAEKVPGPPGDKFVEVMTPFLQEAKKDAERLKAR